MPQTLQDIVKRLKTQGYSAIEVQKYLRDNNYAIPWAEVKIAYNKA